MYEMKLKLGDVVELPERFRVLGCTYNHADESLVLRYDGPEKKDRYEVVRGGEIPLFTSHQHRKRFSLNRLETYITMEVDISPGKVVYLPEKMLAMSTFQPAGGINSLKLSIIFLKGCNEIRYKVSSLGSDITINPVDIILYNPLSGTSMHLKGPQ